VVKKTSKKKGVSRKSSQATPKAKTGKTTMPSGKAAKKRITKVAETAGPAVGTAPPCAADTPTKSEGSHPQITMQASRRFWLTFLGIAAVVVVVVQGYGYLTGWGNPEKVIQRRFGTAQRLTLAKRYPAAIKQYQKIIEHSQDKEIKRQASIAVADLYREQKDWPNAIRMYEHLQGQDDETVMAAWTGLKIAESRHEAGQSEIALSTFRKIRERFPNTDWDAEARLGMGKVFMDQEQYQEAIVVYTSLEKDYQGGFLAAEALVHIGECYAKEGDVGMARRTFQGVIDTYPETMIDDAKKYLKRLENTGKPEGVSLWGE